MEVLNVVNDGSWHKLTIAQNTVYVDEKPLKENFVFDVKKVVDNPKTFVVFGRLADDTRSFKVSLLLTSENHSKNYVLLRCIKMF